MEDNFLNLENKKIDDIAFKLIVSILEEYGNLEINQLIPHILNKTNKCKSKKYKNILVYFKKNHNGIVKFLEKYFAFNVLKSEKTIFISLNKENINLKQFTNDWIIIDSDYDKL